MAGIIVPTKEFSTAFYNAWKHIAQQYACLTKHAVIINFQREFDCKLYVGAWGAISTVEFNNNQQYLVFVLTWS
jgi:hypothetical protein